MRVLAVNFMSDSIARCTLEQQGILVNFVVFYYLDEEQEETTYEESGVSTKTIIIIVVGSVLLVAGAVTVYAYQHKIICFKPNIDQEEDEGEATGVERPLLKNANYSSKVSPSRATTISASTRYKSRPSGTNISQADR